MGWALGYDENWKRDIGYGVPAYCDYPGCKKEIFRGLAAVCGGDMYGGERGCGLYFCAEHLIGSYRLPPLCKRCIRNRQPYKPSPDHPDWLYWKLKDKSWMQWRKENQKTVDRIRRALKEMGYKPSKVLQDELKMMLV